MDESVPKTPSQPHINTIASQGDTTHENPEPPMGALGSHVPLPSEHNKVTKERRSDQTPGWKYFLEIAAILLAGAVAIIYYRQLGVMSNQLAEMQGSGRQTDQLINLYRQQVAQLTKQASDTHDLALTAKEQAVAAQATATAAQGTAATTTQAMKIQASPWVGSTEVKLIAQDPSWNYVTFKMFMANEGSTPAMNIKIVQAIVVLDKRYIAESDLDQYRSESSKRKHSQVRAA